MPKGVLDNLAGQVFGRLTVMQKSNLRSFGGNAKWVCRCECGNITHVVGSGLKNGSSSSCGCFQVEGIVRRSTKHGQGANGRVTPEYEAWHQMIARCENPNHEAYKNYGGRGISVCDRWRNSFKDFFSDVGKRPSPKHSLDRYPNINGNYEPSNFRWATSKQQNQGKRSNVWIEYDGFKLVKEDWARLFGTSTQNITNHLKIKSFSDVYDFFMKKIWKNGRYATYGYDVKEFDFIGEIQGLFGVTDLSKLHRVQKNTYVDLFEVGKDSSSEFHDVFYEKKKSGWDTMEHLYNKFISDIISVQYQDDFMYQAFPTFRVHLLKNVCVGAFHKDSDFNHPPGEVNYVIPLTDADGTASIWVESEENKGDFEAMKMRVGEFILFNGNFLTHGSKINDTGFTRVSMDFRVLPISKYNSEFSGASITRKTKFIEGEYYRRFNK